MAANTNTKPLTVPAIEKIKMGEMLKDVGENAGLRVKRTSRGVFFHYRYKNQDGLMKQVKLGAYPDMRLAEARQKLHEFKSIKGNGTDPQAFIEAEAEKAELERKRLEAEITRQMFTFKAMVDLYLEEKVQDHYSQPDRKGFCKIIKGSRAEKGQKEVKRTLYGDVVRLLGERAVVETTLSEIKRMIDQIIARGARVQAGNVLRELNLAYRFAIAQDKLPQDFQNPCIEIKERIKDSGIKITNSTRSRVLSEPEIRVLLHWLIDAKYLSPNVKGVMQLSLMTGMRTGEVCKIRWKDIDFRQETIYLAETKSGASRYVQLSRQAIAMLEKQQKIGDYVFTSRNPQGVLIKRPLDQKQLTQQLYYARTQDVKPDIAPWAPHDLRRTVRTQLSKLRCPREVSEAIMGHAKKGIVGTYDLHQYEQEAKEWLQVWCDRLDEIIA